MFLMINECAEEMDTFLKEETKISESINLRSLFAKYSMECIINCIFGIRANTMKRDNSINPFVIVGEQIFDSSIVTRLKIIARSMWPSLFYSLGLKLFDERIVSFFANLYTQTTECRAIGQFTKNDFVELLSSWEKENYITGDRVGDNKTNEKTVERIKVDKDLLVGQCTLFFSGGFETTSTTTNFLLYELAKNKNAQNRVIEEVDAYFNKHGIIKYECVNEMPYVEACIEEALRLYPILGVITREVMNNYTLPTGLQLHKGDRVHIPVNHLHRHPDYFPDPTSYRPERFFGDEKKKIKPFTFIPFGEGPRACIGIRFARMVMYAGLLTIFKKYRIELAENMPQTLKFRAVSLATQSTINIYLKFIPREL